MRRRHHWPLVALLALSLGGCLSAGGDSARPGKESVADARPAAQESRDPEVEVQASASAASLAPARRPPPPRLLGLAAGKLVDVFGAPTLKRRDPPAEVWQYAGRGCVLYLFLYAPPDGTAMTVAHVEASDAAGAPMAARACARRLAAEERPPARSS